MIKRKLRANLLRLSSSLSLPRLFSTSPHHALTTILYHRFFNPGEARADGRTRLKFQLDWLKEHYTPLHADEAVSHLNNSSLPPSPLVVTVDDAKVDVMEVYDIFQEFEIPLIIFVCSGWADNNERHNKATLGRIVDFVRWYQGDMLSINLGSYGKIALDPSSLDHSVDWLISNANQIGEEFIKTVWSIFRQHIRKGRARQTCSWSELVDLHKQGIDIGSHTVTHVRLAQQSSERLAFELSDSKRTIESYIPECNMFAYPFGTADVVDDRTSQALKDSNYHSGFLTHAGFAPNAAAPYILPRLVMPDIGINIHEFRARTRGAQIPFDTLKQKFGLSPPLSNQ